MNCNSFNFRCQIFASFRVFDFFTDAGARIPLKLETMNLLQKSFRICSGYDVEASFVLSKEIALDFLKVLTGTLSKDWSHTGKWLILVAH